MADNAWNDGLVSNVLGAESHENVVIHFNESAGSGTFKIENAGTQRMLIDSAGQVCFGTSTSPNRKLVVEGSVGIYGPGEALVFKNTASSNKQWDICPSGNDLNFNETGAQTAITFKPGGDIYLAQNGGNIGIGTTAPGAKLEISVPSSGRTLQAAGAPGSFVGAFIGAASTSLSYGLYIQAGTNSGDNSLQIDNYNASATRFLVRGDGNVGIGTNNPNAKLQVAGRILIESGYDPGGSAIGSTGDKPGMIAWDSSNIYVCTANYDGSTKIWKKVGIATW